MATIVTSLEELEVGAIYFCTGHKFRQAFLDGRRFRLCSEPAWLQPIVLEKGDDWHIDDSCIVGQYVLAVIVQPVGNETHLAGLNELHDISVRREIVSLDRLGFCGGVHRGETYSKPSPTTSIVRLLREAE